MVGTTNWFNFAGPSSTYLCMARVSLNRKRSNSFLNINMNLEIFLKMLVDCEDQETVKNH